MIAIPFTIELLEPLLIAMPNGSDQNSAESLPYIPGSVVRSAVAGRYIAKNAKNEGGNAAQDPHCRRLFFDEKCFVLNSYRTDENNRRSLPIPLSWHYEKDDLTHLDDGDPVDCTDAAYAEGGLSGMTSAKSAGADGGYCIYSHDSHDESPIAETIAVNRQLGMHIVRPNTRVYDAKKDANVFSYSTLAAGQIFAGAVLVPDEPAATAWRELLADNAEMTLGGSRSAGYGRVQMHLPDSTNWREYVPDESVEDVLIFTLLSDAIVRDAYGQFTADIGEWLGLGNAKPARCFVRTKLVGGFNNHWKLPIPQALAVSAGSVFVYDAADVAPDSPAIKTALECGIGERRSDGFGRIALNWQGAEDLQLKAYDRTPGQPLHKAIESESGQTLARKIADARLRQLLERKVLEHASKLNVQGRASASSLARVRTAVRKDLFVNKGQTLDAVKGLMSDIKNDKPVETSLRKLRVGNQTLLQWINDRIGAPGDTVSALVSESDRRILQIGTYIPEVTPAFKVEYTLRLIELVINRQIRAQRQQEDEDGN